MNLIKGTEVNFPISLEELQALSDELHGRKAIRMNPDATWTGQKHMELRDRIDRAISLVQASPIPDNDQEIKFDAVDLFTAFARYIRLTSPELSQQQAEEQASSYANYARERREAILKE